MNIPFVQSPRVRDSFFIKLLLLTGLISLTLLGVRIVHVRAATTRNVPSTYPTIQAALNASAPGDTVKVAAGTYNENITINVRVTLQGAGSGNNPLTDTILQSAVPNTPVVVMNVGGANSTDRSIIQSMRIRGASGSSDHLGSGVTLQPGVLGYLTFDDVSVVENSGSGLDINLFALLNDIVIKNSNLSMNGSSGFRAPASSAGLNGLDISDSHFDGNALGGFTAYSSSLTNWSIRNSTFSDNVGPAQPFTGYGMYIEGHMVQDIAIDCSEFNRNKGNDPRGTDFDASSGLILLPAAGGDIYRNITIRRSEFNDNLNFGIDLQPGAGSHMENITVDCSSFLRNGFGIEAFPPGVINGFSVHNSNFVGNVYAGVENDNVATLDAASNWWGSATGPTATGNPGGTGDAIVNSGGGMVLFTPFLTSASTCVSTCTTGGGGGGTDYCIPSGGGPAGTLFVSVDVNGDVSVRYDQSRTLNDNSYGTNAIGWPNGHKFNDLTGSDKAEFIFKDANGKVVLDFYLDYISAKSGTPSGYASLGATAGDGKIVSGSAANILAFNSSLARNLNDTGYCMSGNCTVAGVNLLQNSPPANSNYMVTNPVFNQWNFTDSYEVKISHTAFANGGGFGSVSLGTVHNSPAKSGPNAIMPVVCADTGGCQVGYPYSSSNPRTSVVFNENEILAAFSPSVQGPNDTVKLWYSDEHAMLLGSRSTTIKTSGGSTTMNYFVTPLPSNPGSAMNPQVGDPNAIDPSSRPLFPALYITDITNNASNKSGDWQFGGSPTTPHAIFGTWKGATELIDQTKNPYKITITTDADPTPKNVWNLGPGSDPVPAGTANLGYGTEVRWKISDLRFNGQPLLLGHTYRLYFMVHDGDQNKTGGDVGHGCVNVTIK